MTKNNILPASLGLDASIIDGEYQNFIILPKLLHALKYVSSGADNDDNDASTSFSKQGNAKLFIELLSACFMFIYASRSKSSSSLSLRFRSPGMVASGLSMKSSDDCCSLRFWIWMINSIIAPRMVQSFRRYLKEHLQVEKQQIYLDKQEMESMSSMTSCDRGYLINAKKRQNHVIHLARWRRHFLKTIIYSTLPLIHLLHMSWYIMRLNESNNIPSLAMLFSGMKLECNNDSNDIDSQWTKAANPQRKHIINYGFTQKRLFYGQLMRTFMATLSWLFFIEQSMIDSSTSTIHEDENNGINFDQLQNGTMVVLTRAWSRLCECGKLLLSSYNKLTYIVRYKEQCQIIDKSCAICGEDAIMNNPYVAFPCRHTYCYLCLRLAVLDDAKFKCSLCGVRVKISEPLIQTALDER